jgi:uncharacterized repeat protein (TIGR02543 family)
MKGGRIMNKAVQGAARLIFFAVLLFFTGCPDLFHDKEPEKPKEYTVTFDAAGGSPETQTRAVREGASLGSSNMPAEPGRAGYIFDGWYTEAEGEGSEFNAGTIVSEDITVYARWTAPPGSHTVTFKLNNGTNTDWAVKIVISGDTTGAGDFPGDPSRPGYTFAGWNTVAAGSGTPFTASTPVTANITIYAQWAAASPGSHTVAFNLNDGTNTTWAAKTVSSGAVTGTENFPANPSRPGYVFGGWNVQADGGGAVFSASTEVNADITVYAQWTETPAGVHTVIFKLNDGTETIWAAESVTDPGTPVTAFPVPPSRLSYIFTGWNTQADGGGSEFTVTTTVSGNIIVYAKWTGETYTVRFMSNYAPDTALYTKTVTVPETTIADFPADPARTGYNFGSWNTQANGSGSVFTAATAVTGNMTVYAQWDTYSYTVTFNSNSGDTEASPAEKTVASPAVNVGALPAPPSRSSYIFVGWNTQADGGGSEFTAGTTVTGDIRVYARWFLDTSIQYTITFDAAGGSPATQTQTVTNGSSLGSSNMPPAPGREGYIFSGWYTGAEGGSSEFTADTIVSGDLTVYAWWKTQYLVTFDAAGGSPATQTQTVRDGDSVGSSNMPSAPGKERYIFSGWYTGADGEGSEFTAGTMVTGDIRVYARWLLDTSIQYTVTFDAAGGSPASQTRTVTNGSSLGSSNMPSAPGRTGCSFSGWYTEAEGGGSEFTASTTVTGDIRVYAWWQCKVTFDAAGGSPATQMRTITTGGFVGSSGMPTAPTRAGDSFDGWYTEANGGGSEFTAGTIVTESITVYAWWGMPDNLSLDSALTWISSNATGGVYTITLENNETIAPRSLDYSGKTVGITLTGGTTERTIGLTTPGSIFTVRNGVTLMLDSNVTLQGRSDNTASLVQVDSGGTFVMNTGSKISDNTFGSYGSGVCVNGGTFTMSGGTISGNTVSSWYGGGGVCVYNNGIFSMSDGSISGNTVVTNGGDGGGVYVSGGTFSMSGGIISGNAAASGGGVSIRSGTFTMSGGIISDNTAFRGGGVWVPGGTFAMSGGVVNGNILSDTNGNGREVLVSGTFKMSGDARPERVFLSDNTRFITISGPLSGGLTPIDLGVTASAPLANWENLPILKLDTSYNSGDLANLKDHFSLGNAKWTDSPYTETAITGYEISDNGLFVSN